QPSAKGLMPLPVPAIASVHGHAAGGGGFGLVCASDIVIAGDSARFLAGATRVGMVPDAGVSVTLPLLVGLRKAMDIILTNPVLTAAEALEIGLITRVVPDDDLAGESLALAQSLANGATRALGAAKRLSSSAAPPPSAAASRLAPTPKPLSLTLEAAPRRSARPHVFTPPLSGYSAPGGLRQDPGG